jgi:hypothetical protein
MIAELPKKGGAAGGMSFGGGTGPMDFRSVPTDQKTKGPVQPVPFYLDTPFHHSSVKRRIAVPKTPSAVAKCKNPLS